MATMSGTNDATVVRVAVCASISPFIHVLYTPRTFTYTFATCHFPISDVHCRYFGSSSIACRDYNKTILNFRKAADNIDFEYYLRDLVKHYHTRRDISCLHLPFCYLGRRLPLFRMFIGQYPIASRYK